MREKMVEGLIKAIHGPRGGAEEEISGDPGKEYVAGLLVPLSCGKTELSPDSEQTVEGGENALAEDDVSEEVSTAFTPTEIDPKTKPKVFGISFIVEGESPSCRVCVTWGRYSKDESCGRWKRTPYHSIMSVTMDTDSKDFLVYDKDDGQIKLHVRKVRKDEKHNILIVNVLNDLKIDSRACFGESLTRVTLFQPSIRVKLNEGFQLAPFQLAQGRGDKDLQFLYRKKPILARGYMCSAIWSQIDYPEYLGETLWPDGYHFDDCGEFKKPDIRSEFLPLYPDSAPSLEWDDRYGIAPELSTYNLSEIWEEREIEDALYPLVDAYRAWIRSKEEELEIIGDEEKSTALQLVNLQNESAERLERGIELLKHDKNVRIAFCFANRAIWLQNKWRKRESFRWKPFQLAFLILNLEPLFDQSSDYRDYTDLLWVPTGGGKTEAYLAIIAFLIALRRRRAIEGIADESTGGGTAIITRYTLRLLTTQQFRRMLNMITSAEYLRVERNKNIGWRPEKCDIEGDWIYGSMRFSTGLWVGGAVSPNHLRNKGHAIDALQGNDAIGEPAQLTTCPACGSWLSVPRAGLPERRENKLHLVTEVNKDLEETKQQVVSFLCDNGYGYVKDVYIKGEGLQEGYATLTLVLEADKKLKEVEIDDMWSKLAQDVGLTLRPFRASRPGYFGYGQEPQRRKHKYLDFEIFCPNTDCSLNNEVFYEEGVPLSNHEDAKEFPDGLVARRIDTPFVPGSRIPIPAYTVDEQIYHRCPTVLVSTADKIARLAFEPRSGGILGNVDKYNSYYGYHRDGLLPPEETTTKKARENYNKNITPFLPPELILQDELHLMEGPLGSMFGLYEIVVESLIENRGMKPKYIASTATIKEANSQVKRLFARKFMQFPPHGLEIDDSFFIRSRGLNESWNEENAGRIYVGIYSPGLGPHTPIVRIWSSLLNTCYENRNDRNTKYFWTLVGYFNSLRELGGTRGLYRADIVERIKNISSGTPRHIDQNNVVELSSRVNSTDIPQILDELERGADNKPEENPDAIFTTSMFGTGVDIPHLSLMVVNGQPKTTTQYVQATGRVGRNHGGLVVTFLRAGRPRDLSHYEMFPAYHQRKHLEVEPSSVFPLAQGCLARASGPAMVSFLRNYSLPSVKWYGKDGSVILDNGSRDDINSFINSISNRVRAIIKSEEKTRWVLDYFKSQADRWENIARKTMDAELKFFEYTFGAPQKHVVLGDPHHKSADDLEVVYENAPQSLREIEETTGFKV